MTRTSLCLAALAAVLLVSQFAVSNQQPVEVEAEAGSGYFGTLSPGDQIGLQMVSDRYVLTINPAWRSRDIYTVVTAGERHLVVEDQNRTKKMHIPMWSIREMNELATGVTTTTR